MAGSPLSIERPVEMHSQNQGLSPYQGKAERHPIEEKSSQKAGETKRNLDDKYDPHTPTEQQHLKNAKQENELFPHLKKRETLPEKGTEVSFDLSFLHEKIKETQPSELLVNFESRLHSDDQNLSEFEKKLLASDLGLLVRVAFQVVDMRMEEQRDTLESFKGLNEKARHIRKEKSKVLNDLAENTKLEDYWSSAQDKVRYLAAGIGITTGVGTFSFGVYTGNLALAGSGALSILGGIGNLASQWMSQKKSDEKYIKAVSLTSTLLLGFSSLQTLPPLLNIGMMDMIKLGGGAFGAATQAVTQYQVTKTTAQQYTIQSEASKVQHHHEKNKAKQTKTLGGLKQTELMNEIKAASKQIGEEDKLKERIAQILSPAA